MRNHTFNRQFRIGALAAMLFGAVSLPAWSQSVSEPPMMDMSMDMGMDMAHSAETSSFSASLQAPATVSPQQIVPLGVQVNDAHGMLVTDFNIVHEALMHLIVVSDDLRYFNHLHPAFDGKGHFTSETSFPTAGSYTLFADTQPKGQPSQVLVLKQAVVGDKPAAVAADLSISEKTQGDTRVRLDLAPTTLRVGQESLLKLTVRQADTGLAATDLQPYLGQKGHMVIIRQSPELTRADYLHVHALKGGNAGEIQFMAEFPEAGLYKLWGQFKRGETLVTADFWVKVEE